jgi:hypothetical protein
MDGGIRAMMCAFDGWWYLLTLCICSVCLVVVEYVFRYREFCRVFKSGTGVGAGRAVLLL